MLHLWPNDSDDDANAHTGHWHAVLKEVGKEVGVSLGALVAYVVFWVAAALLLHQLAS
jgi:hypothetical protein